MDSAEILTFWLDEIGPTQWYVPPDGLDQEMRTRFAETCFAARHGVLNDWAASARGALALLLLLDQFPRNIWRGEPGAFASDPLARAFSKHAISRGLDTRIAEPERQFFYLPLEHSESLADQDRAVRLALMRLPQTGRGVVDAAVRHRTVIRRFGRFPSRNAILGRPDTAAERAYRAEGGYMSG